MPKIADFFTELQRRSVIRAAIVHVVFFWLLIQVADVVLPYIGIVDEPVRWAVVAAVGLFPLTLISAWFYEHPWTRVTHGRLATDIILILAIAITAGMWVMRNLPQVVHLRTSIVVLPFAHSGEPLEESLSRALAIEVNSLLMKSKSIDVIGYESAASSVLQGLDVPSVAARLNVQHVLSGTVAASGDSMRIDLQLLDQAGEALWNSVIEDSLENLFSIQEDIATSIESLLGAGDGVTSVKTVAAQRCWMPTDAAAIEKYYTARYYTELRTETDDARQKIADAIGYYRKLIEEYPEFAEAYSGLAWALAYQNTYDPERALPDWRQRMGPLAQTALEHCPTLGEAMHLVHNQYDHDNDWIGTHQQLTAFIEMEPHRTENYQRLSRHYAETGLWSRGIDIAERNYALNPLSVRSIKNLAGAYQYTNRIEEAIELFDLATELGSTAPNWARFMVPMLECDKNVECMLDNLPRGLGQFRESFLNIYPTPAPSNQDEAQVAIDLAMELLAEEPYELTNWFNYSACRFSYLTPLFFKVAEFSEENDWYWHWPNVWSADCADVWASPEFPAFVEEAGLVEYWREVGWSHACRPEGDTFTCGPAVN
jgi:TolB-like protein